MKPAERTPALFERGDAQSATLAIVNALLKGRQFHARLMIGTRGETDISGLAEEITTRVPGGLLRFWSFEEQHSRLIPVRHVGTVVDDISGETYPSLLEWSNALVALPHYSPSPDALRRWQLVRDVAPLFIALARAAQEHHDDCVRVVDGYVRWRMTDGRAVAVDALTVEATVERVHLDSFSPDDLRNHGQVFEGRPEVVARKRATIAELSRLGGTDVDRIYEAFVLGTPPHRR